MKAIIFISFLFSISVINQAFAKCEISSAKVFGGKKIKDFKGKKMVSYYPRLFDFKTYFPESVFIKVNTNPGCIGLRTDLKVYLSKGQRKFQYAHDHEHGNNDHKSRENEKKEIIGAITVNSEFLKSHSYKASMKVKKSAFDIKNIPHRKLYKDIDEKNWYDKVKYVITLVDDSGKKVATHTLILDSPLIH